MVCLQYQIASTCSELCTSNGEERPDWDTLLSIGYLTSLLCLECFVLLCQKSNPWCSYVCVHGTNIVFHEHELAAGEYVHSSACFWQPLCFIFDLGDFHHFNRWGNCAKCRLGGIQFDSILTAVHCLSRCKLGASRLLLCEPGAQHRLQKLQLNFPWSALCR